MSVRKIKREKGLTYQQRVIQLASNPKYRGKVVDVTIRHDDHCPMQRGKGHCTCGDDADIELHVIGCQE